MVIIKQELLSLLDSTLAEEADAITKLNRRTEPFGLILSEDDAKKLLQTRRDSLRRFGRVEFGSSIVEQLICTFSDSPYLLPQQEQEILSSLIETFYYFKNESLDLWGDEELLALMKKQFDGPCHGSVELLQGRGLEQLAREARGCTKDVIEKEAPFDE